MKTTWFIRHGESQANAGHATTDPASIALTPKGIEQAKTLAQVIPSKPDLIIMTLYIRTQQTAVPVIGKFPDVQVEIWPLHEFDFLSPALCTGTTADKRWPWVQEYWYRCDPNYVDGEGAESFNEFNTRIITCLKRLENSDAEFILVFTHGHVLRAIWQYLLTGNEKADSERMHYFYHVMSNLPIPNTCVFKAVWADTNWQIVDPLFNF